jgi:pyrimidine operon attenuation protein/uracil phosphoribosyltransferase
METVILNAKDVSRAINRIAHEILEKNKGCENLALIGIRTRGVCLARRIQKQIRAIEGMELECGVLDITLYRDDIGIGKPNPALRRTDIPFPLDDKKIVLFDDVLYTGRSIRAAIDALMDLGRPSCVQLAVMVDRGHRELPIRPDYVGKNIPTSRSMIVKLRLKEEDEEDQVVLIDPEKT